MLENFDNKVLILDQNFLSENECTDIQHKLFSVNHIWQTSDVKYFYYLPLGLYTTPNSSTYKENLSYKPIMYNLFGTYYEKLLQKLSSELGLNLFFHENLSYPGFHISTGLPMSKPNFHFDKFSLYENLTGKDKLHYGYTKCFSLIIPISLPDDNSGLLLRKTRPSIDRHKLVFDQELIYKKGMLAMWDGNIEHSIKPFTIANEQQYRITMQMHLVIANNKGLLFW
jgi:hypothetical protein